MKNIGIVAVVLAAVAFAVGVFVGIRSIPDAKRIRRDASGCESPSEPRREADHGLVAGVGNIFLGDDGFGPEVVRHLAGESRAAAPHVGWSTTASVACTWPTTC